jgi:hypothetical protein
MNCEYAIGTIQLTFSSQLHRSLSQLLNLLALVNGIVFMRLLKTKICAKWPIGSFLSSALRQIKLIYIFIIFFKIILYFPYCF